MVIKPTISINPLADYIYATDNRKKRIIKQQKNPPSIIVARYTTARAAIKECVKNEYNKSFIYDAVQKLQTRDVKTKWAMDDKRNSILALKEFLKIKFPFESLKCTFTKPTIKSYMLNDVEIHVAPDLILKWEENGHKYIGAVKFCIRKEVLDLQRGQIVSSILADYLSFVYPDYEVFNKYCLCVDIMQIRYYYASDSNNLGLIKEACTEIKNNWSIA